MVSPPALDNTPVTLKIQHQGTHASLSVSSDITLQQLCHHHLPTLNTIPSLTADRIIFKLIIKNPPRTLVSPDESDSQSLYELGFTVRHAPFAVLLLTTELSDVQTAEACSRLNLAREHARLAALKNPAKIRDTSSSRRPHPDDAYRFGRLALLPGLPFEDRRQELIQRFATHPSIRKQMAKFKLSVANLGELHSWIDPQLLGVNQNAGQFIRLRLLTDDLKSVRPFTMVRRVLSHELAHNIFGPHDNKFKELDSTIHKGMLAYDESVKTSSYRLGGDLGDHYEPETAQLDFHCSTSPDANGAQPSSSQSAQTVGLLGSSQSLNLNPRLAAAEAAIKRASRKM